MVDDKVQGARKNKLKDEYGRLRYEGAHKNKL